MITYHYNGEQWYRREWSALHWARNWLIWIGGWEKANGAGWQLTVPGLSKWALMSPFPVSVLGHRITWYGWGWAVKLGARWLTRHYRDGTLYLSDDGTPGRATVWLSRAPMAIRERAD